MQVHAISDEARSPFNIEAEQQVLGNLLMLSDARQQSALSVVQQRGGSSLFWDPVHAQLFDRIQKMDLDGLNADPVTLKEWARGHDGVQQLGGPEYLVRLNLAAVASSALPDYCDTLADLRDRRALISALDEARSSLNQGSDSLAMIAATLDQKVNALAPTRGAQPVRLGAAVMDAIEHLGDVIDGTAPPALPTNFPALDRLIGGLQGGEFVLIGARPSMGKTAVAVHIGLEAARQGRKVAMFSLEMTPKQIADRVWSIESSHAGRPVPFRDMRSGNVKAEDFQPLAKAAGATIQMPFVILPDEFGDLASLNAGVREAKRMLNGLDLLIVDYAQLIRVPGAKQYDAITEISTELKRLAKRENIPVIALSQLNRQVEQREDKRPQLSDLRQSGQLEQDADTVIFCFRDQYYLEKSPPPDDAPLEAQVAWQEALEAVRNRMDLIVAKSRHGPTGSVEVRYNPATNVFWEDFKPWERPE